ncbi:MAG: pseudouridine synthase [Bacteroidota bacterium]
MRLNQFIAHAGVCSRRKADILIAQGSIRVNGIMAKHPSIQVKDSDQVTYQGRLLEQEEKVYWMMNKPTNSITTLDDEQNRKTVKSYLPKNSQLPRVYPVGRLDRNTTGLLLLTNDGYLAKSLAHPSQGINKTYEVLLNRALTKNDLESIKKGLRLEDGIASVDAIYPSNTSYKRFLLQLHSGKNRIIRRIFDKLNHRILALDRIEYAGLRLGSLSRGQTRRLTKKEVKSLYHQVK